MKIDHPLPEAVEAVCRERIGKAEVLYSVPSDLTPEGRFGTSWCVVTADRLLVILDDEVKKEVILRQGLQFKAVSLVGNGRLEMTTDGVDHFLLRYSKALAAEFATIARALSALAQGESARFTSDDEVRVCPNCGRAMPHGTRVCPHCAGRVRVVGRLLAYAAPYWPLVLYALLLYFGTTGLELLTPRISRAIVDRVIQPAVHDFGLLLKYVLLSAAAVAGSIGFTVLRGRTLAKLGNGIEKDLRQMVFSKIQVLSLSYIHRHKTGQLMNRITGDTQRIQRFLSGFSSEMLGALILIIGALIITALQNWRLGLLVLAPTPVVFIVMRFAIRFMIGLERRQWRRLDFAHNLLQDILSGMKVVKAFGREHWEIGRFRKASEEVRDLAIRANRAWNTIIPFFGFIFGFGQYLVLFYGGHLVLGHQMELGELIQFSMYAGMIYGPLAWLTHLPREFAQMIASAVRIFEVIDERPDVTSKPHATRHTISGKVEFEKVTFGYRSHEPVIDEVTLNVRPGEMVGLVGHSGAGKTTLINLVLRLYDVDSGRVLIDGRNIRDISLSDLRSQIGVVLQETFLFSGTILDNIRYAKPDAALVDVIQAAKIANAHDFITHFPDGYDTQVGEKGQRLSGGEAQRIAIARAIIHNPRILILDEATSSVDTETEQQIQDALDRLVRNRTTIAIAHRLATLRNANRLIVIDNGKVAEQGSHDELMRTKGIYYKLITTQRQMAGAIAVSG